MRHRADGDELVRLFGRERKMFRDLQLGNVCADRLEWTAELRVAIRLGIERIDLAETALQE